MFGLSGEERGWGIPCKSFAKKDGAYKLPLNRPIDFKTRYYHRIKRLVLAFGN